MVVTSIRSRPRARGRECVGSTLVLGLLLGSLLGSLPASGQAGATEQPAETGLAQLAGSAETSQANSLAPGPSPAFRDAAASGDVLAPTKIEPLPRFTVGWYCPAPNRDPWREALAFGLGVILIWAMAERRKGPQRSRNQARDTVSH